MVIDQEIIDSRLEKIRANLVDLKTMAKLTAKDFLSDSIKISAAERNLQISIEAMLDIGNHIIAEKGFEQPTEYRDIFLVLGKRGVFSGSFTEKLVEMAGLRNRLVHVYMDIDPKQIYEFLTRDLGDFDAFVKQILIYCNKESK